MTFDYLPQPVSAAIDRASGTLTDPDHVYHRRLSSMAAMYEDAAAVQAALAARDPVIYSVYEKKVPELAGELQWCTSVTMPGRIGREYYMTKGHYHAVRDTAEIYFCLGGTGYMLMEAEDGRTDAQPMRPDVAVYVPARWAHRSINTGHEPLISLCVYPGNAGHDYGTIETLGFRKRIVEINGQPAIVDRKAGA
jgi:glucose-6-phosphate isomerase, archaeal